MLTQDIESGMYNEQVSYSYSKREKTPEMAQPVGPLPEKLYVGHLPFNVSKKELDELFGRYGPLNNIEIKHGGYAFIQYGMEMFM
jgi:RNA recognition motif-containing protein